MTQIFISHSHADVASADRIRTDLEAAGYTVWKDVQSIPPGSSSYVRAIEAGISCMGKNTGRRSFSRRGN